MAPQPTPYEVLDVAREATTAEIHEAWRKKSKTCHPDITGDRKEFDRVNEAETYRIDPPLSWGEPPDLWKAITGLGASRQF